MHFEMKIYAFIMKKVQNIQRFVIKGNEKYKLNFIYKSGIMVEGLDTQFV